MGLLFHGSVIVPDHTDPMQRCRSVVAANLSANALAELTAAAEQIDAEALADESVS
jgi:hypothetical protein